MKIRPPKLILYIGFFSLFIATLLLYTLLTNYQIDDNGELISVISMFLFFFLAGSYLLLHFYNYQISITPTLLTITTEFKKQKKVYFDQIEKVGYNNSLKIFIIYHPGKKVRISSIYPYFLNQIEESKYSEKLKIALRKGNSL